MADAAHTVLIVEDDTELRELYAKLLRKNYKVLKADRVEDAEEVVSDNEVDVILCDHDLPGEKGLDFLTRLRTTHPTLQRILLTGYADQDMFLKAINEGQLYKYLVKTSALSDIAKAVAGALEVRENLAKSERVEREHSELKKKIRTVEVDKKVRSLSTTLVGLWGSTAVGILMLVLLGIVGILILYMLKGVLGIDIFKEMHLDDLL